jgi:hypothetical protein
VRKSFHGLFLGLRFEFASQQNEGRSDDERRISSRARKNVGSMMTLRMMIGKHADVTDKQQKKNTARVVTHYVKENKILRHAR